MQPDMAPSIRSTQAVGIDLTMLAFAGSRRCFPSEQGKLPPPELEVLWDPEGDAQAIKSDPGRGSQSVGLMSPRRSPPI